MTGQFAHTSFDVQVDILQGVLQAYRGARDSLPVVAHQYCAGRSPPRDLCSEALQYAEALRSLKRICKTISETTL